MPLHAVCQSAAFFWRLLACVLAAASNHNKRAWWACACVCACMCACACVSACARARATTNMMQRVGQFLAYFFECVGQIWQHTRCHCIEVVLGVVCFFVAFEVVPNPLPPAFSRLLAMNENGATFLLQTVSRAFISGNGLA